jgi:hypothetical protein
MPKIKCFFCKKKIKTIMPWKCRCEKFYCRLHIDADIHNCSFDYKEFYKQKLIKENPEVISEKVIKL